MGAKALPHSICFFHHMEEAIEKNQIKDGMTNSVRSEQGRELLRDTKFAISKATSNKLIPKSKKVVVTFMI